LFVAAGLIGWLWRAPPKWLHKGGLNAVAAANLPAASGWLSGIDLPQLVQIGAFFMKAGAFVFGSVARGQETADSDVDVMVIGSVGFATVVRLLYDAQATLGRDINPKVLSPDEFRDGVAGQDAFLR
ncbi:nucleotidyltransferase domain-containing protein, partial [Serratia marcescens]|uniref:nucleotidyltransferase domain-containing protein n=1 Tax=Serratia marcescens TaxID=615 RepID=UPI000A7627F0